MSYTIVFTADEPIIKMIVLDDEVIVFSKLDSEYQKDFLVLKELLASNGV